MFAFDNVFQILVSTNIVQISFHWSILLKPCVYDVASIEKIHTKWSSTFQLMIYDELIVFFLCKWDFSVSPFPLNHYYVTGTAKNNYQYHVETDKRQSSITKIQPNVLTCDNVTFFHWFKVYLAKIVNGHIFQPSNPFYTTPIAERHSHRSLHTV